MDKDTIVRCHECVYRGDDDECPMCVIVEEICYDEESYLEKIDKTEDDGFCHKGKSEDKKTNEMFRLAISKAEKFIPRQPFDFDSVPRNRCPGCYNAVRVYSDSMKLDFCPWCGQALDWSGIK